MTKNIGRGKKIIATKEMRHHARGGGPKVFFL
jgi:hypothetical protein